MTVFWRYWLLQVPGWVILAGLVGIAHYWLGLSLLLGAAVFLLWLVKDAVLYPFLKPYYVYRDHDVHDGILGEHAVAQEKLSPRGYVKLRGELWLAELSASDAPVEEGERVVVEAVDGLTLRVRR